MAAGSSCSPFSIDDRTSRILGSTNLTQRRAENNSQLTEKSFIKISDVDPDSFGSVDPDPDPDSESGSDPEV